VEPVSPQAAAAAQHDSRHPSPPWYGAVAALLMFASYGWIFAYTLGPAPGLGALGGWNYVVAAALFTTSVVMARFWRSG
jgi:hypothetical protein